MIRLIMISPFWWGNVKKETCTELRSRFAMRATTPRQSTAFRRVRSVVTVLILISTSVAAADSGVGHARRSTAGPRPKLEIGGRSSGEQTVAGSDRPDPGAAPSAASSLAEQKRARERKLGEAMTENTDGELAPGQYEVISTNGSITRALCPYTCAMRRIPKGVCKVWRSRRDPNLCYVQDMRLPSDAISLESSPSPVD